MSRHNYEIRMRWTGNRGSGTSDYRAYGRDHEISAAGKPVTIPGSADPAFRGDPKRFNPEELLLAALSACHMMSYLHLCAVHGVIVTDYEDAAEGTMMETQGASGHFTGVTLKPTVVISPESDREKALVLHDQAHHLCFIANSVNFPVLHEAVIAVAAD
jgi:organic hydroperoxide reductase OsmC/OhrA